MDWRSKAACLTVDPELFFPIGNTGPAISQVAEAKAVCRECDVQGICLQWAIDNNQDSGRLGRHERRRAPLPQAPRRTRTPRGLLISAISTIPTIEAGDPHRIPGLVHRRTAPTPPVRRGPGWRGA